MQTNKEYPYVNSLNNALMGQIKIPCLMMSSIIYFEIVGKDANLNVDI